MKKYLSKNTIILMVLALVLTSCSSAGEPVGSDDYSNVVNISDNESIEINVKTSATEKQSSTDTGNTQARNDTETFTVSIQLYDAEEGKVMPYSPYLTMQEQRFILDFSMPADKSSVEKSITDNILTMWHGEYVKPVKPTISFNWIDETALVLTVGNLTSNAYCIHLKNSKDATGMHTIGEGSMIDEQGVHFSMLDFEILNHQKIYIFDPDTLNYQEIPLNSRYYYAYGNLSPSGRTAFIGRITSSFEAVHYMPSFMNLTNEKITDPSDDSSALKNGYSVVKEIGGHGIGLEFHEEPWVSYVSKKGTEMLMVPGMIFTIEPMVNKGADKIIVDENNGWTVYTADSELSAQWEVMVLVTDEGYEVLAY